MKKIIQTSLSLLTVAFLASCGAEATTSWTVSNFQVVSNTCNFDPTSDMNSSEFTINVTDTTATFTHSEFELEAIDDDFGEQDDTITAVGTTENAVDNSACTTENDDTFLITLDDGSVRLDNNSTLSVQWTHTETDGSATPGSCTVGVLGYTVPCTSTYTFDLTKSGGN